MSKQRPPLLWSLYFGPYELAYRLGARPMFPGVSKDFASRSNALAVQSFVVTLLAGLVFFDFVAPHYSSPVRYIGMAAFAIVFAIHAVALRLRKYARSTPRMNLVSFSFYAILMAALILKRFDLTS